MITFEQQHWHSWMNGDWKKIKYKDLDWIPSKSITNLSITSQGDTTINLWYSPKLISVIAIPSTSIASIKSIWQMTDSVIGTMVEYKDLSWNIQTSFDSSNLIMIKDLSGWIEVKGNIITSINGFVLTITQVSSWTDIKLIITTNW